MTKQEILQTLAHFGQKPITFETVSEDGGDELSQAVNEPIYHDNQWDLHEAVDGEALQGFWDEAIKELHNDKS